MNKMIKKEFEYQTGDSVKTKDGVKHFVDLCYPSNDVGKPRDELIMFFDEYPITKLEDVLPTRIVLIEKIEGFKISNKLSQKNVLKIINYEIKSFRKHNTNIYHGAGI